MRPVCTNRSTYVLHVQYQVILQSVSDEVTVIGAGVTLREILVAAEALFQEGQLVVAKC